MREMRKEGEEIHQEEEGLFVVERSKRVDEGKASRLLTGNNWIASIEV